MNSTTKTALILTNERIDGLQKSHDKLVEMTMQLNSQLIGLLTDLKEIFESGTHDKDNTT